MKFRSALLCTAALCAAPAFAADVEVLHWWTSGGEAAAVGVLKDRLQEQGVGWVDMPIAGGAGTNAMTVLRARVTAGNPPTAVQFLGFDLRDWAKEGALADLNATAEAEGWGDVIPAALQDFAKYDGKWVAAPVNVHSTNWVWGNKKLMDELGVEQPADWDGFIAALDKAKAAGKTALGFGGQPWQEATVFEAVALSTGGADFYRKVFIDLDEEAIRSDTMKTVFERMETLRGYVDENYSGRDWNLATAMVINGDALFQMMGDWAKGEFVRAELTAGEDFACFRFPGTQGVVTFNSDMFAMFKVGEEQREAQAKLAAAVEDPVFQSAFNVVKGSVPARTDVPEDDFDACGKKGMADLREAAASGNLIGSMAHGYAAPAPIKNAFFDVVTAHFSGEYGADDAIEELLVSIETAQ